MNYKIVVLGSGGVGKSALTVRYHRNTFTEEYDPTIEDTYQIHDEIDGQATMLDVLDTAGQEEFKPMREQYMADGRGFLLVYAVNSQQTFEEIKQIRQKIYQVKNLAESVAVPIVLVGNKCDLEDQRAVSREEAETLAKEWGAAFFESSAKDNVNVREAFVELIKQINNNPRFRPTQKKKSSCNIL
eukprot:gnl/Trimastix_PCT/224.p2 GENE.gnl/Trimastix_PCT/224~~gnl/Trimastix_PCT/224.p2  ORF type:complete len:215 (-),score=45.98 gnl/Trimastix_PCT/224:116-673(-)